MVATLEFRAGAISGLLGGKSLRCLVRPQAGSRPSPGLYHIHPPVRDVLYGPVAMMIPAGVATGGGAVSGKFEGPGAVSGKFEGPGAVSSKFDGLGAISSKFEGPGAISSKIEGPGWVSGKATLGSYKYASSAGAGLSPSFVLSAQPVPDRHCVVIESNFADLLEALHIARGGAIRVL